jgi:hypothetical protein
MASYMGNMLRQSREMLAQMDLKTNTLTDSITMTLMNTTLEASPLDQNDTTSPPRKQQHLCREEGNAIHGWRGDAIIQLSPNPCSS